ncbi:hypothetical protein GGI20_000459 [Coemansia sp. BCRC 34301]|nr:hypothetical protein GGI20_000459 [Coemansia sp. BCRC 34301]
MEPNNLYVFHQGDGIYTPNRAFLFVFPFTERLSLDVILEFATSVFTKKNLKVKIENRKYSAYTSYYGKTVLAQVDGRLKSRKALMGSSYYYGATNIYVASLFGTDTRGIPHSKLVQSEEKMNKLIELYESLTEGNNGVSGIGTILAGKNIHYYDERKAIGYAFDKRSDEGKAFIQAKMVAKMEKLAIQRTRNASDKRRCKAAGVSRQQGSHKEEEDS